jgi:hypothetical protein
MTGKELLQEAATVEISMQSAEPICGVQVHINHHLLAAARKHDPWPCEAIVEAQKTICAGLEWKNMFDKRSRGLDSIKIRQILTDAAR